MNAGMQYEMEKCFPYPRGWNIMTGNLLVYISLENNDQILPLNFFLYILPSHACPESYFAQMKIAVSSIVLWKYSLDN